MCRGIVKHQDVGFGEVEIAQPRQGYATCLVASMGDALVRYVWKWLHVVLLVLLSSSMSSLNICICIYICVCENYCSRTWYDACVLKVIWNWHTYVHILKYFCHHYYYYCHHYYLYTLYTVCLISLCTILLYSTHISSINLMIHGSKNDKTSVEFSPQPTNGWLTWKWEMNRTWKWHPRWWLNQPISSWWLNQPIWKICSSNWIISPSFGVKIQKIFETTT